MTKEDTRFKPQGEAENAEPHLLVAKISPYFGGVEWSVVCPYEGRRDCGAVEECYGTEADVAKWGCELFPSMPKGYASLVFGVMSEKRRKEWQDFEEARERWRNEVHDGHEWHRTDECWFVQAISSQDYEPEEYLSAIPVDTEIKSPLKVMVGYEGYGEDVEPVFKLWEEHTHADS